jgi:elongator complex protein 1
LDLYRDSGSPPFDYGLVGVLDGRLYLHWRLLIVESLKLTPLRLSNLPPPMAASELILSSTPSHVAFDSTGKNFAILRDRDVDIATWREFSNIRVANPKIVYSFR